MLPILIINSAPFTQDFVAPIVEFYKKEDINYSLLDYSNMPENLDPYSGIIISASPKGDNIIDEQLPIYHWLKEFNKPVLGSCHGHQLMAVLFGSKIIISHESEEGWLPVSMKSYDELLIGLPSKNWMVEQHHLKSVSLPQDFSLLASSAICQNQVMKHKNKPMYGCQFHVESQTELLINFAVLCDSPANNEIILNGLKSCKTN